MLSSVYLLAFDFSSNLRNHPVGRLKDHPQKNYRGDTGLRFLSVWSLLRCLTWRDSVSIHNPVRSSSFTDEHTEVVGREATCPR